jgi:twitching motility two-component system response regulator PilH
MKKILIVEKSPTILSVADSLLRQRGYDVTCLSDGNKALDFARKEHPDLILTAIGINGIDGLQLCKGLTSESITGGIPVVLLMGEKDSEYADKIELCGARGKIKKPFSPKELISVVDKFTGGGDQPLPKVVNQEGGEGPRLKPKVESSEVAASEKSMLSSNEIEHDLIPNHDPVYNLDWQDLKDDPDFEPERAGGSDSDDSGLEIEDDQYGLTKLPEEIAADKKNAGEDYDWFIGEMKKEISGSGSDKKTEAEKEKPSGEKPEQDIAYQDLGPAPVSKDDAKYHQFLEQFKKDAGVMTKESPPETSVDLNSLVDQVADKLAQRIIEKIDKNEIRQIIRSILGEKK